MGPQTATAGGLSLLAGFYLGYAAMLAVPGPNVLGVGGIAALRGLRGAAPLCLGTAAGAGALSAALLLCAGAVAPAAGWAAAGQLAGAVLLRAPAGSILRRPPPAADAPPVRP